MCPTDSQTHTRRTASRLLQIVMKRGPKAPKRPRWALRAPRAPVPSTGARSRGVESPKLLVNIYSLTSSSSYWHYHYNLIPPVTTVKGRHLTPVWTVHGNSHVHCMQYGYLVGYKDMIAVWYEILESLVLGTVCKIYISVWVFFYVR